MEPEKIRLIIETCHRSNPCRLEVKFDEPMASHTSFKVGGPADCWVKAGGGGFPAFAGALLAALRAENIPFFILGGGANILVADRGIRGLVLDTGGWAGEIAGAGCIDGAAAPKQTIEFRSGTTLDAAAETAAARGLGGLEFLAGMPGNIGGALWMNARAYEREIADVLGGCEIIDFSADDTAGAAVPRHAIQVNKTEFGYKRSPFQKRPWLILSARFALYPRAEEEIRREMERNCRDREAKGHYQYPSAGSVFKNNRNFGKPAGKIIDELGLRGLRIGGAQIAPFHGNIIINSGGATAADIRALLEETAARVKKETGFILEPEILPVGEWE